MFLSLPALYISRGGRLSFSNNIVVLSVYLFTSTNRLDPDEAPHYAAFIWVFNLCRSTHLGVSSIQNLNILFWCMLFQIYNEERLYHRLMLSFLHTNANIKHKI